MTTRLPVRLIEVVDVQRLTPHMTRITFGGEDLAASFAEIPTTEPDQQMKLYFPRPGQTQPRLPEPDAEGDFMRWYAAYGAAAAGRHTRGGVPTGVGVRVARR